MSEAARAWLRARRPAPPAGLLGRLEEAVMAGPAAPAHAGEVPDALFAAGLRLLGRVIESDGARPAAYDLLAADALLTYALEAAAEAGPDALARLVAACGPERFARLLPGQT